MNRTRGFIHQHSSVLENFYRIVDAVFVVSCFLIIKYNTPFPWSLLDFFVPCSVAVFYYFCAELIGLYRSWRGAAMSQVNLRILGAWAGTSFGFLFLVYISHSTEEFPRRVILSWLIITPVILILWRLGMEKLFVLLRKQGRNLRKAAIAGAGDLAVRLAHVISDTPAIGLHLEGFYDDHKPIGFRLGNSEGRKNSSRESAHIIELPDVIGSLDELVEQARSGALDFIYVALPMRAEERIHWLVRELSDTSVQVYIIPDLFIFDLLHARWSNIKGIPAIKMFDSPFYGVSGLLKRVEDLILGGLIITLIAIPMLFIALGVKLASPGPVIFKQRRYGIDGKEIVVWKFRTMTVCNGDDQFRQATRNDSRVFPFGAFLRRASLDELPQFINVIQGYMSIVGPRPHPIALDEQHRRLIEGYMLRNRVKPGITGWAQINGLRGETDTLEKMQKRVEFDLYYIRNWSLWLDCKIFLLTVVKIFDGHNAY
ncbi:MAG: undecaprenyl-phosphate glucose phosphotransferase [Desulfuromonadales bacterium]